MHDRQGSAFRAATTRRATDVRGTGRPPGSADGIDRSRGAARDAAVPGGNGSSPPVGSSPDPLTIGRRLRHIRRSQGRTLADVAGLAAISPSALSLIENGKREAKLAVLSALAAGLGTSPRRPARGGGAEPPGGAGDRTGKGAARRRRFMR